MRGETFVALGLVAAIWSSCDDVGRAAGRSADELAEVSRYSDEVASLIRGSDDLARVSLATRIRQIADQFTVPPELKEEWDSLVTDVGCDLATGQLNFESSEELAAYILQRGLVFALAVQDEAAGNLADELIDAINQDPGSDSFDLCSAIESIP